VSARWRLADIARHFIHKQSKPSFLESSTTRLSNLDRANGKLSCNLADDSHRVVDAHSETPSLE